MQDKTKISKWLIGYLADFIADGDITPLIEIQKKEEITLYISDNTGKYSIKASKKDIVTELNYIEEICTDLK